MLTGARPADQARAADAAAGLVRAAPGRARGSQAPGRRRTRRDRRGRPGLHAGGGGRLLRDARPRPAARAARRVARAHRGLDDRAAAGRAARRPRQARRIHLADHRRRAGGRRLPVGRGARQPAGRQQALPAADQRRRRDLRRPGRRADRRQQRRRHPGPAEPGEHDDRAGRLRSWREPNAREYRYHPMLARPAAGAAAPRASRRDDPADQARRPVARGPRPARTGDQRRCQGRRLGLRRPGTRRGRPELLRAGTGR